MAELLVIRHGQASFGADDYDRLSDLGRRQSEMAGAVLRASGWEPDRLITGSLRRQKQTLASMGFDEIPEEHGGFDEYDFHDLLRVRYGGAMPDPVKNHRKTHFRALRDTILDWQAGGLEGARETFGQFAARIAAARDFATDTAARRVLVVSSGGPIGWLVASALQAPVSQMIELNLQVRNTSLTRFMFSGGRIGLAEFNATPHFMGRESAQFVSYS